MRSESATVPPEKAIFHAVLFGVLLLTVLGAQAQGPPFPILYWAYVDASYVEDQVELHFSFNGEVNTTMPVAGFHVYQKAIGEHPRVEIRLTSEPIPWDPTTDFDGTLVDRLVEPDRLYRYQARMVDSEGNLLDPSGYPVTSIGTLVTTGHAVAMHGLTFFSDVRELQTCTSDYPSGYWHWSGEGASPEFNREVRLYGAFTKVWNANTWSPLLLAESFEEAPCNPAPVTATIWSSVKRLYK